MSTDTPPNKLLGQHWLNDDDSLEEICQAADITKTDTILEIGPGTGTLTAKLTTRAGRVIAVELDPELARKLPSKVLAKNLEVIHADILHFDFASLPKGFKVVANIPYYLTSNLLRVMAESSNPFSRAVLLVQKEVAQRVCASPGAMSILSVSVQFYCQVSLGRIVPAELFTPSPKVDSQILILTFRKQPLFPGIDRQVFFQIVRAGFSQRRKTLLNSLSGGLNLDREATEELLEKSDLSPALRAQNLDLDQWHGLYLIYTKLVKLDNT